MTVSELNRQTKHLLEVSFSRLWVMGEISNFARPGSGHWYFTLKDDKAQVRCAMFKNRTMGVRFQPKNGDLVLLEAKASLYEGRGEYQLIGESIQAAGEGALQREFEKLKALLQAEGLFAAEHKKPLPASPKVIGVITSPTGAAVHDILSVTKRRFPATRIYLIPVQVQGSIAGKEICAAIELANRHHLCEVLIVGRGGGSLEDLWAFNEERVARAIFASKIPIVSAVGHETDFTITDFVADYRAPTPSAAAERLTPDQMELTQRLDDLDLRLQRLMRKQLQRQNENVLALVSRLKTPAKLLQEQEKRLNDIQSRLHREMRLLLHTRANQLSSVASRLKAQEPKRQLRLIQESLYAINSRLDKAVVRQLDFSQQKFAFLARQLHTLSPLNTIARGYSILRSKDGAVITQAKQLEPEQTINAMMRGGEASLKVLSVDTSEKQ
jgi:exodeoxyribonuclease VII large subunit